MGEVFIGRRGSDRRELMAGGGSIFSALESYSDSGGEIVGGGAFSYHHLLRGRLGKRKGIWQKQETLGVPRKGGQQQHDGASGRKERITEKSACYN